MKILFTVENYYPKMSGVPNVVKYLAEGLASKGNEVTIVTRAIEGCKEEEILNSVKIIRKNIYYTKLKGFAGDTKEYVDFVVGFECDVVILECSQCITTDLLLPHLKKMKSKKKIFHSHGFSGLTLPPIKICSNLKHTLGNTYNWLRWKIYYNYRFKKYVKYFDTSICLSEVDSSKRYLDRFSRKTQILPNAVEDDFLKSNKSQNKIKKYVQLKNAEYFISIANYQEYKNQIGILKQYFFSNIEEYDLVFIGSERNEYYRRLISEYEKLSSVYGRKPVHFLTNVNRKDIPQILMDSKIYLVGSRFEEFSISIIEAMATKTPFISTNVGNSKLLPGGITIDSINDMSTAIESLICNPYMYDLYANKGVDYVKTNCKIENVVNQLDSYIREA